MGRRRNFFALGLALCLLTQGPGSAFGSPPLVTEVRVGTEEGAIVVEIVASEPLNYLLVEAPEPFTLTFYLPDAAFAFPPSARELEQGPLRKVVASMLERAESRVGRLELFFDRRVSYRVRQEGPRLLLQVDAQGGATGVVFGTPPRTTATPSTPPFSRAASPPVKSPTAQAPGFTGWARARTGQKPA